MWNSDDGRWLSEVLKSMSATLVSPVLPRHQIDAVVNPCMLELTSRPMDPRGLPGSVALMGISFGAGASQYVGPTMVVTRAL